MSNRQRSGASGLHGTPEGAGSDAQRVNAMDTDDGRNGSSDEEEDADDEVVAEYPLYLVNLEQEELGQDELEHTSCQETFESGAAAHASERHQDYATMRENVVVEFSLTDESVAHDREKPYTQYASFDKGAVEWRWKHMNEQLELDVDLSRVAPRNFRGTAAAAAESATKREGTGERHRRRTAETMRDIGQAEAGADGKRAPWLQTLTSSKEEDNYNNLLVRRTLMPGGSTAYIAVPVDRVLQMKPTFRNEPGEHAVQHQQQQHQQQQLGRRLDAVDEPSEATPIDVTFRRKEFGASALDSAARGRARQWALRSQRELEREPWMRCSYRPPSDPTDVAELSPEVLAQAAAAPVMPTLRAVEHLDRLAPAAAAKRLAPDRADPTMLHWTPPARNGRLDRAMLLAVLRQSPVSTFCSLFAAFQHFGPGVIIDLLAHLRRVALLVRGAWVLRTECVQPPLNARMRALRDIVLGMFDESVDGVVRVGDVLARVRHFSDERVRGVLAELAVRHAGAGYEFKTRRSRDMENMAGVAEEMAGELARVVQDAKRALGADYRAAGGNNAEREKEAEEQEQDGQQEEEEEEDRGGSGGELGVTAGTGLERRRQAPKPQRRQRAPADDHELQERRYRDVITELFEEKPRLKKKDVAEEVKRRLNESMSTAVYQRVMRSIAVNEGSVWRRHTDTGDDGVGGLAK